MSEVPEAPDGKPWPEPEAPKGTTPEQRRRNVRLVQEVEEELAVLTNRAIDLAFVAHKLYRDVDGLRAKLRQALGKDPLDPPPPIIEKLAAAAAGEEKP